MHHSPWYGRELKESLLDGKFMEPDVVDIAIRLFKQLDMTVDGRRWRHFLETDFAVLSLYLFHT